MQYLFTVVEEFQPDGSRVDEAGSATPAEDAAIQAFNDRLIAEGHWQFAGGLAAPNRAVTFDGRVGAADVGGSSARAGASGRAIVSDGPFAEAREYAGGLWILDIADDATARELGAEASRACNRRVEVRPFLG